MASTEARICNIALLRIGQRATIASLDEASTQARACKELYADARDAVLGSLWWPFATKRAELTELASIERSGWEYVYSLPADLIEARYIDDGSGVEPAEDEKIPFETEHEAGTTNARVLLTDYEDAELVYTARITPVVLFPPLFVQALAWKLASDLALALPVKPAVGLKMEEHYRQALADAGAVAFRERQPRTPPDSIFVRGR